MIDCVVSRYKKNVDWVYKLNNIKNIFIYDKETPENPYNIPVNKGQEASVYLKYIIDNYEQLPDYTFFIHDDEYAWHHSGSIIDKYNEAVASKKLYYNINDKCVLGSIITNPFYDRFREWYDTYIEEFIPIKDLPSKDFTLSHNGSAQFLVHSSRIKMFPIRFYERLYNWIITTEMSNYDSGRCLEWTWHIFWDVYPQQQSSPSPSPQQQSSNKSSNSITITF